MNLRMQFNSFDYWKEQINKSRTIRGHVFVDEPINKKTVYLHSLIFCKNTGIENVWAPFPNAKALLGYIQYSFLQEAFYKWIYSREEKINFIPYNTTEEVISKAARDKKITSKEENNMRRHLNMIKKCWDLSEDRILLELRKFSIDFNKTWLGDNTEFIYLKTFSKAEDLGAFVLETGKLLNTDNKIEDKIGMDENNFIRVCKTASSIKKSGEELKDILAKKLTEIL